LFKRLGKNSDQIDAATGQTLLSVSFAACLFRPFFARPYQL
jgi:hypothetical protein